MTSASIVKIGASASVLVAACSAALIFGVPLVQNEEKLERGPVTATTSPSPPALPSRPELPSQPQLGVRSEAPPALAATEAKPAAVAAESAGPSSAVATDQSAPSFDVVRIEGADAVIAGRAAPGGTVDLLRGSERLDQAVADASGQFVMVSPHLPAGSYELTLSARLPDGTVASSKQGVKLTVSDTGASSRTAESRAEYTPGSGSQARSQPQPPLQAAKPQANATLRPAQAHPGSSASEEGVTSPAVAPRKLTTVVSPGDSLWRIGRITYGDGTRYALVYRANRGRIRDPNLIYPGQVLVLPMKRH
ncbi:nucleoid-associated protein YgaU [Nitrobacteraceae bacterium AZCC 1564]